MNVADDRHYQCVTPRATSRAWLVMMITMIVTIMFTIIIIIIITVIIIFQCVTQRAPGRAPRRLCRKVPQFPINTCRSTWGMWWIWCQWLCREDPQCPINTCRSGHCYHFYRLETVKKQRWQWWYYHDFDKLETVKSKTMIIVTNIQRFSPQVGYQTCARLN